jgi:hypothetical protein
MRVNGLASITPRARLNEHDHQIRRRLEMLPVGLVPKPDDVLAELAGMVFQPRIPLSLVLGFHRIEIRRRWNFRVHDDVLAARKADDHVRRQPDALYRREFLEVEVAVFDHASRFDDSPELQFAPLSADVGGAQGLDETACLRLQ